MVVGVIVLEEVVEADSDTDDDNEDDDVGELVTVDERDVVALIEGSLVPEEVTDNVELNVTDCDIDDAGDVDRDCDNDSE